MKAITLQMPAHSFLGMNIVHNPNTYHGASLIQRRRWYEGGGEGGNEGGTGGNEGGTGDKTFTQADVDRIVQERLARSKTDARTVEANLLKQFGVDTVDAAKSLITKAKDAEAANLTAAEQAQNALKDAQTALEQARAAEQEARTILLTERRDNAVTAALKDAGVKSLIPARLTLLAGDTSKFTNKDGTANADAIKAAVDDLKKNEANLFDTANGGYKGFGSTKDGTNVNPDAKRAEEAKARIDNMVLRRQTR